MRERTRISVLLVALILALSAAPATAATKKMRDARDAPAPLDIVRTKVTNSTDRVVIRIKVRDLGRRGIFSASLYATDRFVGLYDVATWRKRDGSTRVVLTHNGDLDTTRVSCPGLTSVWRPAKDRIRLVVPATCIAALPRSPLKVRLYVDEAGAPYVVDNTRLLKVPLD